MRCNKRFPGVFCKDISLFLRISLPEERRTLLRAWSVDIKIYSYYYYFATRKKTSFPLFPSFPSPLLLRLPLFPLLFLLLLFSLLLFFPPLSFFKDSPTYFREGVGRSKERERKSGAASALTAEPNLWLSPRILRSGLEQKPHHDWSRNPETP